MTNEECIDTCNELLRGELAAVETYCQAQEKFSDQPQAGTLTRIRETHAAHVDQLTRHVVSMGGTPSRDSGPWGGFAKAVTGGAKMLGETTAIQALIVGERHGISEYEDALNNEDVMSEIKTVIRGEFLPDLRANVSALEQLPG